jgi:cytochrome c
VLDDHGPLQPAGLTLYLDGSRVMTSYDPTTGRLVHSPSKRLPLGNHTARIVAEDAAGNIASRSWSFTIAR